MFKLVCLNIDIWITFVIRISPFVIPRPPSFQAERLQFASSHSCAVITPSPFLSMRKNRSASASVQFDDHSCIMICPSPSRSLRRNSELSPLGN